MAQQLVASRARLIRRQRSKREEEKKKLEDLIKPGAGKCLRRKKVEEEEAEEVGEEEEEECVVGLVITDQPHDHSLIRGECCLIGSSRWLNVSSWSSIMYVL